MEEMTTIQIEKKTRELLASLGRKGETYDEIINKLIGGKNGKENKRIKQ